MSNVCEGQYSHSLYFVNESFLLYANKFEKIDVCDLSCMASSTHRTLAQAKCIYGALNKSDICALYAGLLLKEDPHGFDVFILPKRLLGMEKASAAWRNLVERFLDSVRWRPARWSIASGRSREPQASAERWD
jgi:hypothetical protein